MMKAIAAATAMTLGAGSVPALAAESAAVQHRYLIERTFPEGALDGVDATVKAKVNANNQSLGVNWEKSYANANKTKTYCIYNAPNESAVRDAAKLNGLPIDNIIEVPLSFKAEPMSAVQKIANGNHRYLVTRRSDAAAMRSSFTATSAPAMNASHCRNGKTIAIFAASRAG